ncbi:MAG: hypothetical protein IPI67_37570 [Myxococcales bacterium]|nr:hypothetical protein [Myxococcales bacterium]
MNNFTRLPLLLLLTVPLGCKDKAPPPQETAPRHKNREEALQVFEKHREEFVRCEKLRKMLISAPSVSASPPSASASSRPAPAAAASVSSSPSASGNPAPVSSAAVMSQRCDLQFWKDVKEDMGPYDQAEVDVWWAEWRKGVKIE